MNRENWILCPACKSETRIKARDDTGHVEFKNVKFGYEGTDKTIIHNFSATAKSGQKIAIVGPTDAGSTSWILAKAVR